MYVLHQPPPEGRLQEGRALAGFAHSISSEPGTVSSTEWGLNSLLKQMIEQLLGFVLFCFVFTLFIFSGISEGLPSAHCPQHRTQTPPDLAFRPACCPPRSSQTLLSTQISLRGPGPPPHLHTFVPTPDALSVSLHLSSSSSNPKGPVKPSPG